jgi:hypothetical protein
VAASRGSSTITAAIATTMPIHSFDASDKPPVVDGAAG